MARCRLTRFAIHQKQRALGLCTTRNHACPVHPVGTRPGRGRVLSRDERGGQPGREESHLFAQMQS